MFSTPDEIARYRAIVIKNALRIYAKTGRKVNSAYTPKNMIKAASDITGKTFKPRSYEAAADALDEWLKTPAQTEDRKCENCGEWMSHHVGTHKLCMNGQWNNWGRKS